ncbi:hypothetical protein [Halomonas sp. MCCC 1A11062]|uniref:hypothetical protein n=1 Tax=Halomonas sp. MCCC 1A11062 TaxID=2733485 RepID=UPI001F349CA6|nr:hypothetical protein [Halomonas sp. MCCC 1A11062]MCE8040409.1 hypothetical protein [Halomonas sp. MCCC 1A11062]
MDELNQAPHALVVALAEAWRNGTPLAAETARRLAPDSRTAAYATQAVLGQRLGWWPAGRPHAWKLAMGQPPLAAPIPDALLLPSPARLASWVSVPGIEVELAVRLSRALLPGAGRDECEAAVGETLAVIERFDVRAEGWPELPQNFLLADLQMHAGLVLGSGVQGWPGDTSLTLNIAAPPGSTWQHPLGDPLALLPWLAEHAAAQGWTLQAGDLIATGSWCGMYEVPPGGCVRARFDGIGEVELKRSSSSVREAKT